MKRLDLPREEIIKLYKNGKTLQFLREKYNCSNAPIQRILKEAGIKQRSNGEAKLKYYKPSEKELYDLYHVKEMSPIDIAKSIGSSVASIQKWIRDYGFEIRSCSDSHLTNRYKDLYLKMPPKDELIDYYWNQELSLSEIGDIYNKESGSIFTWFECYNISRRTISEAKMGHEVTDETREKIGISCTGTNLGEDNPNWNGGKDAEMMRRRGLGYQPLNDKFPGSDGHHITKTLVIYIPKELHQHISHNLRTGYNIAEINMLALQYLHGCYDDGRNTTGGRC